MASSHELNLYHNRPLISIWGCDWVAVRPKGLRVPRMEIPVVPRLLSFTAIATIKAGLTLLLRPLLAKTAPVSFNGDEGPCLSIYSSIARPIFSSDPTLSGRRILQLPEVLLLNLFFCS